jgi:hypothetical protein
VWERRPPTDGASDSGVTVGAGCLTPGRTGLVEPGPGRVYPGRPELPSRYLASAEPPTPHLRVSIPKVPMVPGLIVSHAPKVETPSPGTGRGPRLCQRPEVHASPSLRGSSLPACGWSCPGPGPREPVHEARVARGTAVARGISGGAEVSSCRLTGKRLGPGSNRRGEEALLAARARAPMSECGRTGWEWPGTEGIGLDRGRPAGSGQSAQGGLDPKRPGPGIAVRRPGQRSAGPRPHCSGDGAPPPPCHDPCHGLAARPRAGPRGASHEACTPVRVRAARGTIPGQPERGRAGSWLARAA